MKKIKFIVAGLCMLLSACSIPVTYLGDRLAPTNVVEIYYSGHDIKREYKVIGHLTAVNNVKETELKKQLTDYAKTIGADAIIITGTDATKDNQAAVVTADAVKYTN